MFSSKLPTQLSSMIWDAWLASIVSILHWHLSVKLGKKHPALFCMYHVSSSCISHFPPDFIIQRKQVWLPRLNTRCGPQSSCFFTSWKRERHLWQWWGCPTVHSQYETSTTKPLSPAGNCAYGPQIITSVAWNPPPILNFGSKFAKSIQ